MSAAAPGVSLMQARPHQPAPMARTRSTTVSGGDRLIAGLDLGGTKIAAVLAHRQGLIGRSRALVPADTGAQGLAPLMRELIDECCRQAGVAIDDISSVGVSSCGPFGRDPQGGLTILAPNLPHQGRVPGPAQAGDRSAVTQASGAAAQTGLPLGRELDALLPAVTIVNDAAAALLAEHRFGVLHGAEHCAYMTWSTGIGFGLMSDGRLLRGKHGNAGHAGHAVPPSIIDGDPVCGCGNVGDLESLAGGAALARAWGASPESLFAAARSGEPSARRLIERAIDAVAAALYNLVVTLDLERVAIGGGLFGAQRDSLLEPLRARVLDDPRRRGLAGMLESVRIEPVADPARTAELGALCIVMPEDWAGSGFHH